MTTVKLAESLRGNVCVTWYGEGGTVTTIRVLVKETGALFLPAKEARDLRLCLDSMAGPFGSQV
jgi:hypothetical protein